VHKITGEVLEGFGSNFQSQVIIGLTTKIRYYTEGELDISFQRPSAAD